MPTLTLGGIRFSYSRRQPPLFDGLNLTLGNTEGPTVLLGLNGAGKTTLLRLCAGELKPSAGSITMTAGLDPRSSVSLMPQQIRPIPGFRVIEQVAYSAWLAGCSSADSQDRAVEALRTVQLDDHLTHKPDRLSGGQLRRVGLAQALVGEQPIILLDEPTAGLDPAQRRVFRDLLTRLGRTRSLLVSTHDTSEIDAMYTRVIVLDKGRIVHDGCTQDFLERGKNSPHPAEEAFLDVVRASGASR